MAVSFTRTDLDRLLQMLIDMEAGTPVVNPHLAFGFRELAGTNNNQVPGQSTFGSADQPFPTVTQPFFQTVTVNVDGTPFDLHPGTAGDTMTTTYASTVPGSQQAFGVNVVDPAPRMISNLIADVSANNPAAVAAAQAFAAQLGDGYTAFNTNPNGLILPGADGVFGTADDQWGAGKDGIFGNADDLLGPDGAVGGGDDLTPVDFNNLFIGNITPDAGLSAPFNNWMTFFGQFFDHGLDLISKGGNGYVYIPLAPDDPLITLGQDGIANTGDELTDPAKQFMILTRATDLPGPDGKIGTADDIHQHINQTSPFVDQNQTYGSEGSHNAFLREYVVGADGKLHTTGKMLQHTTGAGLDGVQGDNQATIGIDESIDDVRDGMATWADLKANALRFGLIITDHDVGNIPVLATDAYGNLLFDALGNVRILVNIGGTPTQVSLNALAPQTLSAIETATGGTIMYTGHAFINDMAAAASPFNGQTGAALTADTDSATGLANTDLSSTANNYDNELLDAHYVAGDGRVNENIALTTVHGIFHDEHNRLVDSVKALIQAQLDAGDTAFASNWVLAGTVLTPGVAIADNEWNGERIMQVAKFGTETQYQHLVFEEFARKVAPTIHLFGNVDITLDPAITSEFANAVYRFGHSMLDENVPIYQLNPDGTMARDANGQPILTDMGLIEAFTNPLAFAQLGATGSAQIIQGTTHQIGSEIDEFVTGSLRNNLLGLPLDLAALNIARGRDVGVAPLNLVRAQIYAATNDVTLKPYANWTEFGQFLKHPESLINFLAAYGTHASITSATTLDAKRLAAVDLVKLGLNPASVNAVDDPLTVINEHDVALDAYNFMHSLGVYANDLGNPLSVHGTWSTGSITGVDNIDLWIGGLAEKQNLFGGLLGSTFNFIFETQLEALQDGDRLYYLPRIEGMDFAQQIENNSFADMIIANTGAKHIPASIFLTPEYTVEASDYFVKDANSPDGFAHDVNGNRIATDSATWLRNPVTGALLVEVLPDGTLHFLGDDNFFGNTMVLGGTEFADRLQAGHADGDTVWGDGGNDWIDGGNGDDFLYGGAGDDTIVDSAGLDVIHGNEGNDTIFAGLGDDTVFGNDGNDYIEGGMGIDAISGGAGNDIIKGGEDDDELTGNEGDDWIEGGDGGDILVGDTGAPTGMVPLYAANDVLDGGTQGDKMVGFSGDDIMMGQGGFDKFNGLLGFDWADFEKEDHGVSIDMERRVFVANAVAPAGDAIRDFFVETEAASGTAFDDFMEGTEDAGRAAGVFNELTNVNLIFNLDTFFVGGQAHDWDATGAPVNTGTGFDNGNILLGGDGNDIITGRSGNDIIDGDAYLHVYLSGNGGAGSEIVREIAFDVTEGDIDTAVYRGRMSDYTINLTPDENGFITVTHNGTVGGVINGVRVPVNEGTDKLRNIERLQFADGVINIDPSPTANLPPTGSLLITDDDANPATPVNAFVGTALSIDLLNSNIGDPDGIDPLSVHYQWQQQIITPGGGQAWIDIANQTGTTFTPSIANLGNFIRVVESYTDLKGWHEQAFSAPTALVLAAPVPLVNTAPFIVNQQGLTGLPDTNARTGFPINLFLPLTQTFGDNETAANNLIFSATLGDGSPLPANLVFTLIPDAVNGGVSGATITGTVNTPGPISIKITATDLGPAPALTVTDTFLINVQTGNLPPVISIAPESATTQEDVAVTAQLLGPQVPDPDGPAAHPVWRLVAGSVVNGTVALNGNTGQYVFTPAANIASSDADAPVFSFQYRLFDGVSFSAVKTVNVTVTAVDDGAAALTITGTAAEGETLTAVIGTDPDGPWQGGTDHYQWVRDAGTVNETIIGTDSMNYVVTEADIGHTISASATYIDAQGATDATGDATNPASIGQLTITGVDGAAPQLAVLNTLTDPDSGIFDGTQFYTWEVSTDGVNYAPADFADVSPDGLNLNLQPTDVLGAYAKVTVTFIDGLGNFNSAAKVIHYVVTGSAGDFIVGIGEDDVIYSGGGDDTITAGLCADFVDAGDGNDTIIATANDGNDTYIGGLGTDTLVLTGAASDYTIVENLDGSFTVTDNRAVDGNGVDHVSGVENFQFGGVNIPVITPTANPDAYQTNEDTALNVSVAANGVLGNDLFFLPLGATIDTNAAHGNVVLNANGTFTYTPNANYAGTDSFTYVAASGSHSSAPVTVTLTVHAQNDGDAVVAVSGTAAEGQTLTASITTQDPDGAGTTPTFKWLRDGIDTGATGSTYVLGSADIGAHISVQAIYVDGQGFSSSPTSAATAAVASAPFNIINGTAANNTIAGTASADRIHGLGGLDQITAGAGNDQVFGDDGNDTFFASVNDGDDTYDGGAGSDTYNMSATAGLSSVNLQAGTATSGQTGHDILISIENVTGSAGDNEILGNDADNTLVGNGGNDTLDGGLLGADILRGGTGNDIYIVSHAGMTLTENAGQGTDTVKSSIGFTLGANFENLTLTGSDNIAGTGNNSANVITGNSGNNALAGLGGNDTFIATVNDGNDSYNGGTGTDTLDLSGTSAGATVNLVAGAASSAQIGSDTIASIEKIIGSSGADFFTAGAGQETFTGGAGGDTFIFLTRQAAGTGANGRTIITDFQQGSDKIDVTAIDAINGGADDNFVFDAVAKASSGQVTNGHLGYFHTTINGVDHTIIEGNIQGIGGATDFQIDLVGNYTLTHDDLLGLV